METRCSDDYLQYLRMVERLQRPQNEPAHPVCIRFFRANAVVQCPDPSMHLVQEFGRDVGGDVAGFHPWSFRLP